MRKLLGTRINVKIKDERKNISIKNNTIEENICGCK